VTSTLTTLFALFLGTSLFVAGVGLIGTALALRADALGFSGSLTGAVMAAYFAGFVVGTYWCPRIVMRVGHVRAFSALAATSAAAVLLHALWVSPEVWALLRFITGACVVGLYMVIESWLNERSANEVRGRIFAVYQVISLLALALGQYLILWGRENPATAFVVAGALFSIGLVPVVLTRVTQPLPISSVKLDLRALWTISPLGVAGTFAIALANGALFALGPMFAQRVGLSTPQIALFMSLVLLGGVALQWPIGHLSDRWDRRTTILIVSLVGALLAVLAWLLLERHLPSFLVVMFCYGGAAFTLYPLCVAHANDIVPATNFVTIAGGLLLVYGIGAAFGPLLVGALIQGFGAATFLLFLAAMQAGLAVFVLGRMRSRAPPPLEAQEPFVMLARTSQSALEMLAPEDTAPDNTVPADR
jgi:MFS family permease